MSTACCSRHHRPTIPTVPLIEHLSIFKGEIMGFLEGDCTDHRHPTTEVLRCHLAGPGTQTHVGRMAAREIRSVPAHSDHQSRDADRSHRLQSKSSSPLEGPSLAQTLQNRLHQASIRSVLDADPRTPPKLDVNRTCSRPPRCLLADVLAPVRDGYRNQRCAGLGKCPSFDVATPLEYLVRVHVVNPRHLRPACHRSQR